MLKKILEKKRNRGKRDEKLSAIVQLHYGGCIRVYACVFRIRTHKATSTIKCFPYKIVNRNACVCVRERKQKDPTNEQNKHVSCRIENFL